MQRAFIWILAWFLLVVAVAVPAALACVEDSQGLELIDGELPGGG